MLTFSTNFPFCLFCESDICWLRKVEACLLAGVATRHIRSCLRGTQTVKFTLPGTVAQLSDHLLPVSCPETASRLTLASQPHSGALCYESAVNQGPQKLNYVVSHMKVNSRDVCIFML